jgi:hypothetical protein
MQNSRFQCFVQYVTRLLPLLPAQPHQTQSPCSSVMQMIAGGFMRLFCKISATSESYVGMPAQHHQTPRPCLRLLL